MRRLRHPRSRFNIHRENWRRSIDSHRIASAPTVQDANIITKKRTTIHWLIDAIALTERQECRLTGWCVHVKQMQQRWLSYSFSDRVEKGEMARLFFVELLLFLWLLQLVILLLLLLLLLLVGFGNTFVIFCDWFVEVLRKFECAFSRRYFFRLLFL